MSKLKIDLDFWAELALKEDPADIANHDVECAAEWVSVMLEDEKHPQLSIFDTMRKHPQLVGVHASAHAINRFDQNYRTLEVEKLRLLESISVSLESIAHAAESSKGKSDE